ncbi:J domain-containing protein [Listeria sp. FSL L7-1517]|uniref:hypothetical protein n=1 Tax=Listeria immobilis TaxID=2713502 RepID=UPI00164DA203|nr:hypothetical protein [Listeria immobilis]MBC6296108.1 J domain-containing protein [Listeria immobilis]
MDFWDILEIEATRDKKAIKKAYAIKLKQIRADENPTEFQLLKEAYDAAVKYCKGEKVTGNFDIVEQVIPPNIMDEEFVLNSEKKIVKSKQIRKDFMLSVYSLIKDYSIRLDLSKWEKACESMDTWDHNVFLENQKVICLILYTYYKGIPKSIIHFLFERFELLSLNLAMDGSDEIMNDFIGQIQQIYDVPDFQFANYSKIPKEERDSYYDFRYDYYYNLNGGRTDSFFDFKKAFDKAEAMQVEDADFMNILAQSVFLTDFPHNIRNHKIKKYAELALEIDKENPTSKFLYFYSQVFRNFKISRNGVVFLESNPTINLKLDLLNCMSGFIYYFAIGYNDKALLCWEQVENSLFFPAFQRELAKIRTDKDKEIKKVKIQTIKEAERKDRKKIKEIEAAKKTEAKRIVIENENIQKEKNSVNVNQAPEKKWRKWILILLAILILAIGIRSYLYIKQVDENKPNITEKEQKSINNSIKNPKLDLDGR